MAIKHSIGKLNLGQEFGPFIKRQIAVNDIKLLHININHVIAAAALPLHHRDPFDRMLVAQSLAESIPLVSADVSLDAYAINRLW
ncbi:MAG: type II toxin-antitoxin system VapC family toxin [Acidobacteriota bacterium]